MLSQIAAAPQAMLRFLAQADAFCRRLNTIFSSPRAIKGMLV